MNQASDGITDLWFRTELELVEIARLLDLYVLERDAENEWEWLLGRLDSTELDLTRRYDPPPVESVTRLFRVDNGEFEAELRARLAERLVRAGIRPVTMGRWEYLEVDDFRLVEVWRVD